MIEISPPCSAPALSAVPIFTGFIPMVSKGLVPGRAWLDRAAEPRAAHVLHSYGMSLLWGDGLEAAFEVVTAHLRDGHYRQRDEWLQIDPRFDHLPWDDALPDTERFTRVNFRFDEAVFAARHRASAVPNGWRIVPLPQHGYALEGVTVSPHFFWNDYASFTAHGGGMLAVSENGEPGAMAFTATRGEGWLEIGIETLSAYRGQGLARAVAVAMIEKCLSQGLEPVWACRKENAGSFHLAQSLGFAVTRQFPFYRLAAA
ncbi:RimJ/RimL family protein N-acetyltransferase [Rhizomicrobium palustre]|uniref:RimJ/RimL family protein N-acetyltransferase n=1 Tax=Rhizomicrobium palustre TaxID=189966 RepID=A0A846N409_9PROT|nr:GNAT family N-acetyltransferase [Rhizomicrobium palustre]NIK90466.1 RimJ/RimL family protein N-acetyltransferase [Rhizomicrobium palustre]